MVRNRLDETLLVESARVVEPRGCTIARPPNGVFAIEVRLGQKIPARGDPPGAPAPFASQFDYSLPSVDVSIRLPSDFRSGALVVEFTISSMALTIRSKRVVTRMTISVASNTPSAANA